MRIIGLMSGTSADGVDAALVELEESAGSLHCKLTAWLCRPWEPEIRAAILDACRPDAPLQKIALLNYRLAEGFADAALQLAAKAEIPMNQIDAIASHGQTVWHQPEPIVMADMPVTGTLQIGEPAVIAARTGRCVIADFRCADMALGGQGAPLVPLADLLLFAHQEEGRLVLNLGGIANITYLPPSATPESILAFDTGPGNMLLDGLIAHFTDGRLQYDRGGELAKKGEVDENFLEDCLCHPYFLKPPPKSTGREAFGSKYIQWFAHQAGERGCSVETTLATATALTAETVARACREWILPKNAIHTVIAGGGGVHNFTLMQMLTKQLAPARVTRHAEFGLPDDAKEAVAFAILGYRTLNGLPGSLPAATGASRPAILGKIVHPP